MALKNLLVLVDNTKAAATRIAYATSLAAKHDAHLTGLYVKAPIHIPGYALAQMQAEVREMQQRFLAEGADGVNVAFVAVENEFERARVDRAIGERHPD